MPVMPINHNSVDKIIGTLDAYFRLQLSKGRFRITWDATFRKWQLSNARREPLLWTPDLHGLMTAIHKTKWDIDHV